MNSEPKIREGLPGVCMDRHVHYACFEWDFGLIRGPLSDRAIARYLRQGRYRREALRKHPSGGNLVWTV
jgi:hypothetical protein